MISEWGVPAVSATGCFKNTYKVGHLRKKSPPQQQLGSLHDLSCKKRELVGSGNLLQRHYQPNHSMKTCKRCTNHTHWRHCTSRHRSRPSWHSTWDPQLPLPVSLGQTPCRCRRCSPAAWHHWAAEYEPPPTTVHRTVHQSSLVRLGDEGMDCLQSGACASQPRQWQVTRHQRGQRGTV